MEQMRNSLATVRQDVESRLTLSRQLGHSNTVAQGVVTPADPTFLVVPGTTFSDGENVGRPSQQSVLLGGEAGVRLKIGNGKSPFIDLTVNDVTVIVVILLATCGAAAIPIVLKLLHVG
jgi:hypothetical protein